VKDFIYFEPATLEEAVGCFQEHGSNAWKLAGGTDLLVRMKRGEIRPAALVNLKRIKALEGITWEKDHVRFGALTTVSGLLKDKGVQMRFPALYQAAAVMASPQVRELATLGGNICNASPAADLLPPLSALDAKVEIACAGGSRQESLLNILAGPRLTTLSAEEVLAAVILPQPGPGARSVYLKHGVRRAHEIAIVGVAVCLVLGETGRVKDARIALGAVGPTVFRAGGAEEFLLGQPATDTILEQAGELAMQAAQPVDDIRASAWYRREMVRVLTVRALKLCLNGGGK